MRKTSIVAVLGIVVACGGQKPPASAPSHPEDNDGQEEEEGEDQEPAPSHHGTKRKSQPPCAADLASCGDDGCEQPNTPHAVFNHLKRRTTNANGDAITLANAEPVTLYDFAALQKAADKLFPNHKSLTKKQREDLTSLSIGGRTLGEGTGVRLATFIAPSGQSKSSGAHEGGIESVNCRLTAEHDRDVHIPVVNDPGSDTECQGVVVETIPQMRAQHPHWTSAELKKIAKAKTLVMFVGPLFYDNEHLVNDDCAHLQNGQPKRMSLWEIHPVVEVYVCETGSCKASSAAGWRRVD